MPLIDDFVCSSTEKEAFAESNDETFMGLGMCMPCENEPPDLVQGEAKKAHHCCKSVTDVTNQNLGGAQRLSLIHI